MKKLSIIILAATFIASCTASHKTQISSSDKIVPKKSDSLTSKKPTEEYQAAATKSIDILHTKLEVNFDWEKQYMNGKATITFKPHFYSEKEITLDAKSFDIKEVSLLTKTKNTLTYTYNKNQLTISLDKEYTRNDTLKIFIDYVAKPNEREVKTGNAITSDKGLYFINPQGKEKNKPTEMWTQGETESSSCWFPRSEERRVGK